MPRTVTRLVYTPNQVAHHRQRGFVEEPRALLGAHSIEYDDRYLRA